MKVEGLEVGRFYDGWKCHPSTPRFSAPLPMTKQVKLRQLEPREEGLPGVILSGGAGPWARSRSRKIWGRGLRSFPPPRSLDFALRAPLGMTLVNRALSAPRGALGMLRMTTSTIRGQRANVPTCLCRDTIPRRPLTLKRRDMADYRFLQVDVFTHRPFGGNPLAVFPDAEGLTDEQMQNIAREMNLSETTFVFPAKTVEYDFKVRIFTPAVELPLAGHPVVGTRTGCWRIWAGWPWRSG